MTHLLIPDDLNIPEISEWERDLRAVRGTQV
jgi:hypothetical protein